MSHLDEAKAVMVKHRKNQRIFHGEDFAVEFQAELEKAGIPYYGKLLAFRRSNINGAQGVKTEHALCSSTHSFISKDRKTHISRTLQVYPKIILNDAKHPFNQQVVANQTYFWTEIIAEDSTVYCFDYHYPEGILKQNFLNSLNFCMEIYFPEEKKESNSLLSNRDISAQTYFADEAHRYKTHEEVLAKSHLLLVDISAAKYREHLQEEPNWQYFPALSLANFPHIFLNQRNLQSIISPPDEKTQYSYQCMEQFQNLKQRLNSVKTTPGQAQKKDPQFFKVLETEV